VIADFDVVEPSNLNRQQYFIDQIGQYKNDNVMMTNAVICLKDRARAREIAMTAGRGYLVTMVNLYHDTMPKSPDARTWPEAPVAENDTEPSKFFQLIAVRPSSPKSRYP